MKKKLALVCLLIFFSATNVLGQWVKMNGLSNYLIWSLGISDSNFFAGIGDGIALSTDNGNNWSVDSAVTSHNEVNAFISLGSHIIFGGGGLFLSTDDGITWKIVDTNLGAWCFVGSGTKIFAGNNGLLFSTDTGRSWKSTDNIGLSYPYIFTMVLKDTVIFAGNHDGIFRSTDYGKTWQSSNNGMTESVQALALLGSNLYAAAGRNMFISTDNGANWNKDEDGLPDEIPNVLIVSGANLFVGTDSGVYFTTDSNHWQSAGLNDRIASFAITGQYLFAGTAGDGIWRRPLSEMVGAKAVKILSKNESSFSSFPNPFSQSTSIKFSTSDHSFAQVSIHNLLGSEVARLFSGELEGGEHSFTWDAHEMAVGMYVCIVKVGSEVREIPIVLVK